MDLCDVTDIQLGEWVMCVQSGGESCIQWKDMDYCELTDEETQRHLFRIFNTSDPQTAKVFQKVRHQIKSKTFNQPSQDYST